MKEESWRDYITISVLNSTVSGTKPRYSLSEIAGVTDSYKAIPGETGFASLGQFVFALNKCCGSILIGQCVPGTHLTPWGICCNMVCGINSACSNDNCFACGFSLGTAITTYLALGSVGGCGATLFRRIA